MTKHLKNCVGRDSFERMNYLYQASTLIANNSLKTEQETSKNCSNFLSSYYSNLAINIAKKSVLRIAPDIKRTICKGCKIILIPGETAKVRMRKKPQPHIRWTCLKCYTFRVFNTKRDYEIWYEKPDALVELLDFNNHDKHQSKDNV